MALAVVADEELAKAILFVIAMSDPSLLPGLEGLVLLHRPKQGVARFAALLARLVAPALREVSRIAGQIRRGKVNTGDKTPKEYMQDAALSILREQGKARPTSHERTAILHGADVQTLKNACLYVDLRTNGAVSTPTKAARPKAMVDAYLAALRDRVLFFTYMVIGNVKKGQLTLTSGERKSISDAWTTAKRKYRVSESGSLRSPAA